VSAHSEDNHYQFVFAHNVGHADYGVKKQTLPEAVKYLKQGYWKTPTGQPSTRRPSTRQPSTRKIEPF
jgi:hypothetical protein